MQIEQTKLGHSVQLRIGASRRRNFTIAVDDPTVARARAEVMTELARLLVDRGRLVEAQESLSLLGQAQSDEEFQGVVDGVREVCADPVPRGKRRVTFGDLAAEWTSGRLAKKFPDQVKLKKSSRDDLRMLGHHCKTVGDVPLVAFSLADGQRAMAALPATAESASTRRQYAQVIRKLMAFAVFPCCIIASSPIPKGFCPKPAARPEFQCLYPSDDAKLMRCAKVDIWERAFFGFSVRHGGRLANFLDLTWSQLDLVNAMIWIPESKTGKPVGFDLDAGTVRALAALRQLDPSKPASACVFPQYDRTKISKRLRSALVTAGIDQDRPQLFVAGPHQALIHFHDLRASFVTMALANGRSEEWIRERTGHTTSQMIAQYRRPRYAKLPMTDWIPLDVALGLTAPAESTAPSAEVDHGSDVPGSAGDQRASTSALPAPEQAAQGSDDVALLGSSGEVDALHDLLVGQADGAIGNEHGALQNSGVFGWQHLAASLAGNFFGVVVSVEETSMIQPGYLGGSRGARTPGLRIKSSARNSVNTHETAPLAETDAQDRAKAHELPRSSLRDDMLERIAAMCVEGRQWDIAAAVTADLDAIARLRATQSNVTQLLVERRKRSGRG